ncbi:MAG: hypothetical protein GWN00_31490, partial [Aliifodinibius sp.]|nr:hypothetical protein [Fodinibius sp.]NIV15277.1 hypothetical protein [Fodinibius sp.]NIY29146.1 hypothetical protein [Fodinibius sp.]
MYTTMAIDVETSKDPVMFPWQEGSFVVAIGIALETGFRKSWVFNHNESQLYSIANIKGVGNLRQFDCQQDMLTEIQLYLNMVHRLVGHNLKFDLNWLHLLGLDTSHLKYWCTQVTEYLLRGQREIGRLKLTDLSKQYLNIDKIDRVKMMWDAGYETSDIPLNILIPYLEQDCINPLAIYQRQVPKVKEEGLQHIVTLQNETTRIWSAIECNGMGFDLETARNYAKDLSEELEDIDYHLHKAFS